MIHVSRGATRLGAFPEEEVHEGLRDGKFMPSDLGWREGMADWQLLSQFPEFATDIAAAPTAPPPQIGPAAPSTPPPAEATLQPDVPRTGLPWDQRREKGLFNAFIETLQLVLSKPAAAFTAMRREGGLGEPLLYAVLGGSFGVVFAFVYNFVFRSFALFPTRHTPFDHAVKGVGLIFLLILMPLFIVIGTFIGAAIYHVCLMIVGGAKQSFETTFRVICFGGGSVSPLLVVPFCGSIVVFIWKIVVYIIGLARAHEIDTGRAVLAVLLPLIVCCGGGLLLAIMFGAIGAWSASQH